MPRGMTGGDGRVARGNKSSKVSGGAPQQKGNFAYKTAKPEADDEPNVDPPAPRPLPIPEPIDKADKPKADDGSKVAVPAPAPQPVPVPEPVMPYYYPPTLPAPPRPLPTPSRRPRRSVLARLVPCLSAQPTAEPAEYYPAVPPVSRRKRAPSPASEQSWTHHDSYFPSLEPAVVQHTSFFPRLDAIKSRAQARAEAAAAQHAQSAGHLVCVHYPDLPAFAEYGKARAEWKETQWGTQNWIGFGWNGERLPNAQGQVFSGPMPTGIPVANPKVGGGGKNKKGQGGSGGAREGVDE
ncbi:hypothetical protein CspeluHIS016_0801210 [Cutaneotrichosporon spelunceum]|uniref:Uncharacterized protein n=1 Tax=Cutaneotrichosporon spelunceum TaxID=1672016 RepID=A0AAD3TZT8_9TREE|nr:hypothetical protein CspeluHIS016_0801210 [Cutaneotrichosporon spelunceum]